MTSFKLSCNLTHSLRSLINYAPGIYLILKRVAESSVIFFPIFQLGCFSASAIINFHFKHFYWPIPINKIWFLMLFPCKSKCYPKIQEHITGWSNNNKAFIQYLRNGYINHFSLVCYKAPLSLLKLATIISFSWNKKYASIVEIWQNVQSAGSIFTLSLILFTMCQMFLKAGCPMALPSSWSHPELVKLD